MRGIGLQVGRVDRQRRRCRCSGSIVHDSARQAPASSVRVAGTWAASASRNWSTACSRIATSEDDDRRGVDTLRRIARVLALLPFESRRPPGVEDVDRRERGWHRRSGGPVGRRHLGRRRRNCCGRVCGARRNDNGLYAGPRRSFTGGSFTGGSFTGGSFTGGSFRRLSGGSFAGGSSPVARFTGGSFLSGRIDRRW